MVGPTSPGPGAALGEEPGRGDHISQAGEERSARIESLRALAALSVFACHALLYARLGSGVAGASLPERLVLHGGNGVFLFFGLTGYLLFWPFAKRSFGTGDSIDLRRYAVNRALRILPLYFAVVIILLVVQEGGGTLGQWGSFLTFSENFSTATVATVDPPIWSVVVEVHFYILLPLLAYALAKASRGSRRRAALILLGLGAAALAVRYQLFLSQASPSRLWRFSLPVTFLFFVPGMLLALLRLSWEERRPGWVRGPFERADVWLLATLPLWAVMVLVPERFPEPLDPLIGVATLLIIGACVLPLRAGLLTKALEWRPLAVIGVASYSLYLWHVPIIRALVRTDALPHTFPGLMLVALPLVVGAAILSYAAIEARFLRLRRQWARSSARQRAGPSWTPGLAPADAVEPLDVPVGGSGPTGLP